MQGPGLAACRVARHHREAREERVKAMRADAFPALSLFVLLVSSVLWCGWMPSCLSPAALCVPRLSSFCFGPGDHGSRFLNTFLQPLPRTFTCTPSCVSCECVCGRVRDVQSAMRSSAAWRSWHTRTPPLHGSGVPSQGVEALEWWGTARPIHAGVLPTAPLLCQHPCSPLHSEVHAHGLAAPAMREGNNEAREGLSEVPSPTSDAQLRGERISESRTGGGRTRTLFAAILDEQLPLRLTQRVDSIAHHCTCSVASALRMCVVSGKSARASVPARCRGWGGACI